MPAFAGMTDKRGSASFRFAAKRCKYCADGRRRRDQAERERAGNPGRAREEGAVARELDHPPRQSPARERRWREGRRASGLVGLARHHHDRALFPRAAPARSRGRQAACEPDLPRHPISARPPEPAKTRGLSRLQGRTELSLAQQGYRRRRLFHRLGGLGGGANAVLLARAGLRPRPWLGVAATRRAHDRARRRRRARRRQHLRGDPRGLEARPAQLLVDHRLQPPEPRCGDPRGPVGALRGAVQSLRLGRGHSQIRRVAAAGVPRERRRALAPMDRQLSEPALLRARLPGRRRLAPAASRRDRRPRRRHAADRGALGRGAGAADDQPRGSRPPLVDRSLRQGRSQPADLLHLLHHQGFRAAVRRPQGQPRRPEHAGARIEVPAQLPVTIQPVMSTQTGFGALLNELGRENSAIAERVVTASPDVTVSTNLGPWVNRRGLFAREKMADTFKSERIPSTFNWDFSPKGQHIELGIAEMNLFILLSALGLSHAINGERLIPIGTLYDPFIQRGLDALNYACYQDARFILVATPSGITLAPEGGAHQSIATPLIGLAQDGLAAFEPAFVDELAAILAFAFDYIQRDAEGEASERNWLRDETGGSVYLRLSTRPIEQIKRAMTGELRQAIVDGAYWQRPPGPNCQVVVAYTGAVVPEAIQAVGLMAEDRRDVGLLAVTSADRLNAGWTAAQRARERGLVHARSHIEKLMAALPSHCGIVTVLDGHPATLAWLGAVHGHRARSLGVEHFGQTGSIPELYRHYGIDADAIVAAAAALTPGRPIRYLRALG